jgi:hypothetical protein
MIIRCRKLPFVSDDCLGLPEILPKGTILVDKRRIKV